MRLTPRDLSLLEMLCRNTVMSFEEVRLRAFDGRHKATVCNRLSKLEQMALLRRISVGNFIYKRNMRPVGVVIQITKRGIEILKQSGRFDERWKEDPVPVNIQSLIHDLELNEVARGISERLPGARIINGKHLSKEGGGTYIKIPDAVLELTSADLDEAKRIGLIPPDAVPRSAGSLRVAVELELTAKSDRRYREIVTHYRLSREVDRVLYLSHDGSVFRKIQGVLAGFPVKGEIRPHSGIFSFLPVAAVASRTSMDELKNGSGGGRSLSDSNEGEAKIETKDIHQTFSEVS